MRKIKNLIIILTIFLSVGIIGIKQAGASDTYSEEFKKLTSGTLTLTQSSYDNDTNQNLVENYIIDFNSANGTNFDFLGCESELTSCSIGLWVEDVYETHEVSIEFKDIYSSKFQELTNNRFLHGLIFDFSTVSLIFRTVIHKILWDIHTCLT